MTFKQWLARLFHFHEWKTIRSGVLVHYRGAVPHGHYYTKECTVCGKVKDFHT